MTQLCHTSFIIFEFYFIFDQTQSLSNAAMKYNVTNPVIAPSTCDIEPGSSRLNAEMADSRHEKSDSLLI